MTTSPVLWFLNRSTGLSLLLVLSVAVALGVLTLGGRAGGDGGARVPRFVTRSLHRNVALVAVTLLAAHTVTAVADSYVDIRWLDAVVPWGARYEPVRLAFGTVALDLLLVVVLTSALRQRLGPRMWKAAHLTSWLAWFSGTAHGLLIGTDLDGPGRWHMWSLAPSGLAIGIVAIALCYRVLVQPRPRSPHPVPAPLTAPGATRGLR